MNPIRRRPFRAVALSALGVAAALLLLEGGVRLWFSLRGSEREKILYLYDAPTIAGLTGQLVGLPYLNYGPNPALADVNERGYRGEAVAIPKPAGVFRAVALGGSTTYGHNLTAAESWPAQLQLLLRGRAGLEAAEVVNLGVPGFYSLDSVVNLATRGLAHDPDLVIVYHGINDAIIRMFQDPACYAGDTPLLGMGLDRGIWQYTQAAQPPSALYRLLGHRLGWLSDPAEVNYRLEHTGFCPPEPGNLSPLALLAANPPTVFERNLRSLIGMARGHGADVLLATFALDRPSAEAAIAAAPDEAYWRAVLAAIDEQNALIRALAAETGAGLADVAAEMGPGPYFQGDLVHQTAAGVARQAAIMAAALQ